MMNKQINKSDAARSLGSVRTPKKAAASAANGKKGGRPLSRHGYVVTDDGQYFVQLLDDSQFGFSIHDDDQQWPGGVGLGTFRRVRAASVPKAERDRLGWILAQGAR